ncbi:Insulin-like growth factor-binding protein complex acid labile subunit [Frankliniella fusca]|uniref:Insulin-like growth factor-binding protein complex acid labile subunit n=1 Tax=Frankliniella fusca TaxID=407009 RepID=A0AAE1I036_9NEOP|nr:Insulin-like growth factor-binding protein complex acid labile subunit [Frankliniella fusca]
MQDPFPSLAPHPALTCCALTKVLFFFVFRSSPPEMASTGRGPTALGVLLCVACLALPLRAMTTKAPALAPAQPSSGDSIEMSEDKDLVYEDLLEHHSVVCPKPMCECRYVGSGGIMAKCSSLDFKGQRFQGVVNHFEVSDAPEFADGLFLLNNSLASLGLQFVTTVKITNSSIKGVSLTTFEGLSELYDVDLSNNHIMIPHQDLFVNNTVLRKLSLRGNPIGVAQVVENTLEKSYLLNSASLNELDLSNCGLQFLSPHVFSRMKHLERLILSGNKLMKLHPDTLSGLGELEELDLSDNNIVAIDTAMFANNTELTTLLLHNNSLTSLRGVEILGLDELDVSQNLFPAVEEDTFLGFPGLTRLNLSDNGVTRIHPRAFFPLQHLQDLDLSANDISGPLPAHLFAKCDVLETLNLSDNPNMTALPYGGFDGQFSALYQLDISYCGISSLDRNSFNGMDHLSILNLQTNKLTEIAPAVMRRLPQIVTLNLAENRLTTLDNQLFETNGFLRHLDLSGNALTSVSPSVFAGAPYLRYLDLSQNKLTSMWETQLGQLDRANLLRKLANLNVAGNQIQTLRVRDMALAGGLTVLDISENPIRCTNTKDLYNVMEWLVKRSVAPRADRKQGAVTASPGGALQKDLLHAVEGMMEERSLRVRWAAVFDTLCGAGAFDRERTKEKNSILASFAGTTAAPSPAPARPLPPRKGVTRQELEDIEVVLGKKRLTVPDDVLDEQDDSDESDDSYYDTDDSSTANSNVEDASEEEDDDDEDDEDDDDDEYDDTNLISDSNSNGTDYLAFTHRGNPYLWPVLTIGALLATTVLVVSNVVVCLVRRRRARRHARFQSPMFRQLGGLPIGGQHKVFGGIPGSFIKTKKDGGFVYKKLYEETTTPVFVPQPQPPQARTFRFPLDPSDLQSSNDPQRV